MRKVFHGGVEEVRSPLVNIGRDNLDFGKGFYVTDIRRQAKTWAEIKCRYQFDAIGVISEYLFDVDAAVKEFCYKRFEHYDREWLYYIVECRSGRNVGHSYDIVEGGVADDRVVDTVEAFIAGQIEEEKALGELAKHQPNNQICILKQAVVDKYLTFQKSTIIENRHAK